MAADDTILKRIEERLTRLEGVLSQGGGPGSFGQPGGTVVDPPPWGGGIVSDPAPWPGGHYYPFPWRPFPFPNPIADPAPWGGGQYGGGWRIPNPIADPAPYPFFQASLAARRINVGPIGDPPPIDIGRFTISQLEASLHTINAERARLDSMESMVKHRIAELKKG
jgi:hypothetical protein